MQVRLKREGWPRLEGLEKAFDTGDSWSLFRDGSRSLLCLAPAGRPHPLWVAAFAPGAGNVDLFCPLPEDGGAAIDLPFVYPLDQLLLMHYFAGRRGVLVHGAGLKLGKRIYLFAGASGAGKSTFSELLARAGLGTVLSDERMIVRSLIGGLLAFGTPWAGTAGIARPGSAPLAGIFFLRHGLRNEILEISAGDAADRLLAMASIPWYDPESAAPIVAFIKKICAAVPCREFRFTPARSAVEFLRRGLSKGDDSKGDGA